MISKSTQHIKDEIKLLSEWIQLPLISLRQHIANDVNLLKEGWIRITDKIVEVAERKLSNTVILWSNMVTIEWIQLQDLRSI